ncbi:acyl-CoA dehydrogenase family protein [Nocardia aurantia]|uniref:Acyl-CoA dehydrogenase FadE26 n=1 Tax=Nocardia aurantia TaxID=2585199 RepID=A0A7K0DSC1_9NOCA|nr:acyl-CoA dehydrogenase family protein [Nocardia aurantia]MQY28665.1 Acyl-CoA dehydrogenase FadE26 [Nocardia aurantia]
MKLALSPEEVAFRDDLNRFYRTEIPQEIRDKVQYGLDLTREDVVTTHKILNDAGLAVPRWPVEWGGKNWTPMQLHLWEDELQLASVPDPLTFNANMIGPVIAQFGSQEMKERFLPATAALDIWWCQGFSEPDAGSDLASLRTTAVRDGDSYIVNGQKIWTTMAQWADWIFCLVRTDPSAPKRQAGISLLLFDVKTPGVTIRPIKLIDGRHEVNEVFFENVRVPADQLVGEENQGWTYAKYLLGNERTGITAVGRTKVRLAVAKEYAAQVKSRSGTLLDDPRFAARLAEVENELLALELTLLRVVANSSEGKPNPASSVLKMRGSELQQAATELLLDIAGPDALPVRAGVAGPEWAQRTGPAYLNFRKTTIYGGSSEVQRTIIASTILGL